MVENEAKKVGVTLAKKGVGTHVSSVSVVLKTPLKFTNAEFIIQVNFTSPESGYITYYSYPGLLKKNREHFYFSNTNLIL